MPRELGAVLHAEGLGSILGTTCSPSHHYPLGTRSDPCFLTAVA